MKNKLWIILIFLGILLTSSAVFLLLYNSHEDLKAHDSSQIIMEQLHEMIPEIKSEEAHKINAANTADIPLIRINDEDYCGFLTLPSLGIELPVTDNSSYSALKKTPCRYKGSVGGNDLIIAAHNYSSHFGRITELVQDDEIWFTDTEGYRRCYTVQFTEIISGDDTDSMLEGGGSEWDLTLYTCDFSGQNRIAVRSSAVSD